MPSNVDPTLETNLDNWNAYQILAPGGKYAKELNTEKLLESYNDALAKVSTTFPESARATAEARIHWAHEQLTKNKEAYDATLPQTFKQAGIKDTQSEAATKKKSGGMDWASYTQRYNEAKKEWYDRYAPDLKTVNQANHMDFIYWMLFELRLNRGSGLISAGWVPGVPKGSGKFDGLYGGVEGRPLSELDEKALDEKRDAYNDMIEQYENQGAVTALRDEKGNIFGLDWKDKAAEREYCDRLEKDFADVPSKDIEAPTPGGPSPTPDPSALPTPSPGVTPR